MVANGSCDSLSDRRGDSYGVHGDQACRWRLGAPELSGQVTAIRAWSLLCNPQTHLKERGLLCVGVENARSLHGPTWRRLSAPRNYGRIRLGIGSGYAPLRRATFASDQGSASRLLRARRTAFANEASEDLESDSCSAQISGSSACKRRTNLTNLELWSSVLRSGPSPEGAMP